MRKNSLLSITVFVTALVLPATALAQKVMLNPSNQTSNPVAGGGNEAQYALIYAQKAEAILDKAGFDCRVDQDFTNAPINGNSWGAAAFVSIHTNAFNGQAHGTETLWDDQENAGCKGLASAVQNGLLGKLPYQSRGLKIYQNLYVLNVSNGPACLTEAVFHDCAVNSGPQGHPPSESAFLKTADGQDKIAAGIANGVCAYFGKSCSGPVITNGYYKGVVYQNGNSSDRVPGAKVTLNTGASIVADANGYFQFELAPGGYSATAQKDCFTSPTVSVTVSAGAEIWGSIGLTPKTCNDNNPCTNDSCSGGGCTYVNNTASCSDGNQCTADDRCSNGSCQGRDVSADCDDFNVCTTDTCTAAEGCTHSFRTGACDDGNPCTAQGTCVNGVCQGGSADTDCDDGNACTTDSCDPAEGCKNVPNDKSCDDGNPCTLKDLCIGGQCMGGPIKVCNDANDCTVDSCNPASGDCVFAPGSSIACNDGDLCTQNDRCVNGLCSAGWAKLCNDGNPCTKDDCVPATGNCTFKPIVGACGYTGGEDTVQDTAQADTVPGEDARAGTDTWPGMDVDYPKADTLPGIDTIGQDAWWQDAGGSSDSGAGGGSGKSSPSCSYGSGGARSGALALLLFLGLAMCLRLTARRACAMLRIMLTGALVLSLAGCGGSGGRTERFGVDIEAGFIMDYDQQNGDKDGSSWSYDKQGGGDGSGGLDTGSLDDVCDPMLQDCTCTKGDAGKRKLCSVKNGEVTCVGVATCLSSGDWGTCSASTTETERCDGLDNDCDGSTDEELPAADCFNETLFGLCPGVETCRGGKWKCDALEPGPEICDYIDNNCDGNTDEGFELKGKPCDSDKDNDFCELGVWECSKEGTSLDCQNDPPQVELCDGKDNDCNGLIDDGIKDTDLDGLLDCDDPDDDGDLVDDVLDNCPMIKNPGQLDTDNDKIGDACDDDMDGDGTLNVDDCGPADDTVFPGAAEICDGADNDCDGFVDGMTENCQSECGNGTRTCSGGNWSACSAGGMKQCMDFNTCQLSNSCSANCPATPQEVCNNKDDNCNGITDENFECNLGDSDTVACGLCGTKTRYCSNQCFWGNYGACQETGDCTPGDTETESCGGCGTRKRTCNNSCSWGSWGSCSGGGECDPGDSETISCGTCGKQTRTCTSNCTWGSYGSCIGSGECSPGNSQNAACGNCGTMTRTCTNSCTWGSYGSCNNQGACAPNATSQSGCDVCAQKTCNASCQWGSCNLLPGKECEWKNGSNWRCCGYKKWQFCLPPSYGAAGCKFSTACESVSNACF